MTKHCEKCGWRIVYSRVLGLWIEPAQETFNCGPHGNTHMPREDRDGKGSPAWQETNPVQAL